MAILLYHHESQRLHDTGPGHPERPERLEAVLSGARRVQGLDEREAPLASRDDLTSIHPAEHLDALERFCASGGGQLDADTVAVSASWEAALRSVGAGLAAVEALREEQANAAFLAIRPPGHHALGERAMGFCLLNNVAVAADRLAADGDRVVILDWDVHHGNGTQEVFYDRDEVLYVSLHEFPFYPGTGWVDEMGADAGRGFTVNVPLPAGCGGSAYAEAFERIIEPVLDGFGADWILVSAGYDAHADDPLAAMILDAADYGWMASRLASRARPMAFFLEGGYDLSALERSVAATLLGVSGKTFHPTDVPIPRLAERMIEEAASNASEFWPGVA